MNEISIICSCVWHLECIVIWPSEIYGLNLDAECHDLIVMCYLCISITKLFIQMLTEDRMNLNIKFHSTKNPNPIIQAVEH